MNGPFSGLAELNSYKSQLEAKKNILNEDFYIYVNFNLLLDEAAATLENNLTSKQQGQHELQYRMAEDIEKEELAANEPTEYKVFEKRLNAVYSNFFVDSAKIIKNVSNPSLLEAGVEGVPLSQNLLDWR